MIRFAEWLGHWSVDVYLLASILLLLSLLAMAALRQPVHRLAVVKSLLIGLLLLAGLCAVPGWSVLHLVEAKPTVDRESVQPVALAASPAIVNHEMPPLERTPINVEPANRPAPHIEHKEIAARIDFQPWAVIGAVELLGAIGVVIWLACGWVAARNLCRRSSDGPSDVRQLLTAVAQGSPPKIGCAPKLLISDRIEVPVALGLRRAVIVLPTRMVEPGSTCAIPRSEMSTVLAHELAHIQNCDLYWLAFNRGLLTLFWSQPLYWLVRRRMRLDQESLADAAAAELSSREQYAEQLVGWARNLTGARTMRLASAVGLWEGASQLRQRVALLLDERITILREFSREWQLSTLGLCVVVAAALSLITLRPGQGAGPPEAPPLSRDNSSAPVYEMISADGMPFPLPKANQLAGQVFDTKHMPIANVEISVFRLRQSDATRKLVKTLKTDKNGKYHIYDFINLTKEFPDRKFPPLRDLDDEYLQIIARSPGYASQSQSESIQNVAQNGGSTLIILQSAVTVRGKVTDAEGKPVAGALVSIGNGPELQNWSGANSARTDDAGNYAITDACPFDLNKPKTFQDPAIAGLDIVEVPPALTVNHPGFATKQAVLEKAPGTQDILLERPATIEGSVVYGDSGKPANNVLVQARSEVHGPSVSENGKLIPIVQTASARTGANGKYKFETLPRGEYSLWAEANGWTDAGLVIHTTSGEINHVFDLKLTKGGVISVRLVDGDTGKPLPLEKEMTAMITASPLPYGTAGHAIMQPDISPTPEGRFELRSPPGKMAVSSIYMDDGVARHWLSRGKPVEIEVIEGQTGQIDLPVKAASTASVAHNVDSVYTPENQPPAGAFKGISPTPAAPPPPGAIPVTIPAPRMPPASIDATTLSGQVVGPDGKPLAGVTVDAYTWYPGNETTTDEDGRFLLKGLNPREAVEIEFRKEGYEPRLFANGRTHTPNWVVRMDNSTYLEGDVVDPQGKPVGDALLRAARGPLIPEPGVAIGEVFTQVRSDANGHYRLYLEPDTYDLQVRVSGRGVARFEGQKIAHGEQRKFDIHLHRGETFRAKVVDSVSGKPVQGITLWNWLRKGIEGTSNAEGILEIPDMFRGPFTFNVTATGDDRRQSSVAGNYARWWSPQAAEERQKKLTSDRYGLNGNWDELQFSINNELPAVTIFVEPCVTITGHVVDPNGKPVAGATVAPAATGSGNSITGDTRYSYETDKDGAFEMKLPSSDSGKYNLIAHDGKYENWRQWANGVGEPFQTHPGERIENLTLRLTRPAMVRGRVTTNGKPAVGKQVRAAGCEKNDNRYYLPTTETDAHGNFELKFVSPGKQYIQVEPFVFEADHATSGTSAVVEVKEGQTIDGLQLTPVELPKGESVLLQQSSPDAK